MTHTHTRARTNERRNARTGLGYSVLVCPINTATRTLSTAPHACAHQTWRENALRARAREPPPRAHDTCAFVFVFSSFILFYMIFFCKFPPYTVRVPPASRRPPCQEVAPPTRPAPNHPTPPSLRRRRAPLDGVFW